VFTPVLAKHTKSFSMIDTLSVGVDRIQRNFEPLQRQVETLRKTQITDAQAKLIFYAAFADGKLEGPRRLLPDVYRLYFEPEYPDSASRTMWSLSNAFSSAFQILDPIPQFKATAKLGAFLANLRAKVFNKAVRVSIALGSAWLLYSWERYFLFAPIANCSPKLLRRR
jgi:hypothetical protein